MRGEFFLTDPIRPRPDIFAAMDSLIDSITQFASGSTEFLALVARSSSVKSVLKGTILHRNDEPISRAFFVRKGCLRSYSIDTKGKEHIFMFAPEGWTVGDFVLDSQRKAGLFVDAIEDSEVEVLDTALMENILQLKPELSVGALRMFRNRISVLQRRVIMLMSPTAAERYEDFVTAYPSIVQLVPQRMIASYLGVTPEALSKIRGEIAKNRQQRS